MVGGSLALRESVVLTPPTTASIDDCSGRDYGLDLTLEEGGARTHDACVSVIAAGPRCEEVRERMHSAARALASGRGVRVAGGRETEWEAEVSDMPTGGPIVMGVADVEDSVAAAITVARIVAGGSEDVYRLLHKIFEPMEGELGIVPYHDRVHGVAVVHSQQVWNVLEQ